MNAVGERGWRALTSVGDGGVGVGRRAIGDRVAQYQGRVDERPRIHDGYERGRRARTGADSSQNPKQGGYPNDS